MGKAGDTYDADCAGRRGRAWEGHLARSGYSSVFLEFETRPSLSHHAPLCCNGDEVEDERSQVPKIFSSGVESDSSLHKLCLSACIVENYGRNHALHESHRRCFALAARPLFWFSRLNSNTLMVEDGQCIACRLADAIHDSCMCLASWCKVSHELHA